MPGKLKQDISLGQNLRSIRLSLKMTQEDVVTKLQLEGIEMTRDYYAHIETGAYNIRISELSAIRKIFGVDYNTIFGDI